MATFTIRPNGDVSANLGSFGSGSGNYGHVNEITEDDASGVTTVGKTGAFDDYNFENHSSQTGVINKVTIYAIVEGFDAFSVNSTVTLRLNAHLSGVTGVTSKVTVSWEKTTNPATGDPWTWDEIDSMTGGERLIEGYNTTKETNVAGSMKCYQVWAIVDYTPLTQRSLTDNEANSDAVSRLTGFIRKPTDTEAISDSLSRIIKRIRAIADNEANTDVITYLKVGLREIFDTEANSDAISYIITKVRDIANTEGITDALSWVAAYGRLIIDALANTDARSRRIWFDRSVATTEASTDSQSRVASFVRKILTVEAIHDALVRLRAYTRTLYDDSYMSDIVSRSVHRIRTIAQTVGITDLILRGGVLFNLITDAVGITDATSRKTMFHKKVTDTVGMTTVTNFRKWFYRKLYDFGSMLDARRKSIQYGRLVAVIEAYTDSLTRSSGQARSITDGMSISDIVQAVKILVGTIADTLANTDSLARSMAYMRTLRDMVRPYEVLTRLSMLIRKILDNAGIYDTILSRKVKEPVYGTVENISIYRAEVNVYELSGNASVVSLQAEAKII